MRRATGWRRMARQTLATRRAPAEVAALPIAARTLSRLAAKRRPPSIAPSRAALSPACNSANTRHFQRAILAPSCRSNRRLAQNIDTKSIRATGSLGEDDCRVECDVRRYYQATRLSVQAWYSAQPIRRAG